jgi:phosphoribosylanthranilate isomerase
MPFYGNFSQVIKKPFFEVHSQQVKVKICGVTNRADAESAIEAGADALGFNFYAPGKRYVDLTLERGWIQDLPNMIARVGVIVDMDLEWARRLLQDDLFDALQLHGNEAPSYCESLAGVGKPLFKALRIRDQIDLTGCEKYPVLGLLLDGYSEREYGGTGTPFDWSLLQTARIDKPLILAGGLTRGNVANAIRMVRPYAVDVASGVELNCRKKDPKKMADFIAAAKQAGRW